MLFSQCFIDKNQPSERNGSCYLNLQLHHKVDKSMEQMEIPSLDN